MADADAEADAEAEAEGEGEDEDETQGIGESGETGIGGTKRSATSFRDSARL